MSTDTNTERQRCPRRGELGALTRTMTLLPDAWRRDRWKNTKAEADAERAAFLARNSPGSSMGDPQWHGASPQPRTCSYCGGIHPDDALQLLREGWEVEATDKGYKRYMNPPGSKAQFEAWRQVWRRRGAADLAGDAPPVPPRVWSPLPPVKLYVAHFDEAQVAAFNAALGAR